MSAAAILLLQQVMERHREQVDATPPSVEIAARRAGSACSSLSANAVFSIVTPPAYQAQGESKPIRLECGCGRKDWQPAPDTIARWACGYCGREPEVRWD